MTETNNNVAVIDYGMGNLASVIQACKTVGLSATLADTKGEIQKSSAIILPGVGAFGDAMAALENLGLIQALKNFAASGKPLVGICLGLQLLMTESSEFGNHRGLGLVEGKVIRLNAGLVNGVTAKVPQVGWNRLYSAELSASEIWNSSLLQGISNGDYMYFVHSYYVSPADSSVIVSKTEYGNHEFCSTLRKNNIYGFQFHPERSGESGLKIYENLAELIDSRCQEVSSVE